MLGVALLDVFPEALELGEAKIAHLVTVATVLCGFILYLAIARLGAGSGRPHGWRSQVSIASLVLQSVLDGFGIGSLAYAIITVMNAFRHVKLFKNGRNQAGRILREFELPGDDAIMRRQGDWLILKAALAGSLFAILVELAPIEEAFPEPDDPPPGPVHI